MKFGVVTFPGSNCDDDMLHVMGEVMGQEVVHLWHKETELKGFGKGDCVFLPGGFSYGDYLRSGAIASHSPIMQAVKAFAAEGGYVWGICNGFQVLTESGLLPGGLLRNESQKFICKNVNLQVQTTNSAITSTCAEKELLSIPIAHADGRYYADEATLADLYANDQVLFKYAEGDGSITSDVNPNGSVDNIAGICNKGRNVFGMMPHPERCAEDILGNTDGKKLFSALVENLKEVLA